MSKNTLPTSQPFRASIFATWYKFRDDSRLWGCLAVHWRTPHFILGDPTLSAVLTLFGSYKFFESSSSNIHLLVNQQIRGASLKPRKCKNDYNLNSTGSGGTVCPGCPRGVQFMSPVIAVVWGFISIWEFWAPGKELQKKQSSVELINNLVLSS